ncbi:MAG: hypothetical protein ACPGWM_10080 [Flavobacteriales bacterium]
MPILNYTTSIKSEKTIMEIQTILVKHGATKIVTDYDGQTPSAVTFCLSIEDQIVAFSLPAKYRGVLKAMENSPKVPRILCTDEQALRVSWRIVKDWVEAQMALVEAHLADVAEVFLPYAITKNGNTLYQEIGNSQLLLSE